MKRLIILMLTILISGGATAQKTKTIKVDGVKFTMIYVNKATFEMGGNIYKDEQPKHNVTLNSYYISETVVTKKLWRCIMYNDKSIKEDGKTPAEVVTNVSWNECKEFIEKLNQKTGLTFRLPTEAEWEYAANGGNTAQTGTYGIHNLGNSTNRTLLSKTYLNGDTPNGLGIWYMLGNVWEWCEDWYGQYTSNPNGPSSGTEHVLRGGGFYTKASYCNSTYRASLPPNEKCSDTGLRLAMNGKKK